MSPRDLRSTFRSLALVVAVALLWATALLAGCATARGGLFSEAQQADAASTESTPFPEVKPAAQKPASGLRIVTSPPGATVTVDLEVAGVTPFVVADLAPGSYRITIRKEGFRSVMVWLDYDGAPMVYAVSLEELTGFVRIETDPPGAAAILAGKRLSPDGDRLRVGSYEILVRAFGYEEQAISVEVREDALTSRKVVLVPAAFRFSWLEATRTTFNPANYGSLGTSRVYFRVTAPGSALLRITDAQGSEVLRREYASLDTWDHEVTWDGRDASGAPLPEGTYRVEVEGRGAGGGNPALASLSLRIDTSAVIVFRSVVSGAAGLMYAPSPEVLPRGATQVSVLVLAHAETGTGPATFRVPVAMGLRLGLGVAEVDVEAGTYLSSAVAPGVTPLFGSVSARYAYASPDGPVGWGAAVGARVAYHALSTDTVTDFSGVGLSAPFRLSVAPVSLILTPELVASWTRVSYGLPPAPGFRVWGYCRVGLLLDAGPVMLGLSTAVRLAPFSEGLHLDLPVPVAVEVHLTIPGTQIVLSAALAAEISGPDDYYIMAGGGFGFLQ